MKFTPMKKIIKNFNLFFIHLPSVLNTVKGVRSWVDGKRKIDNYIKKIKK